MHQPAALRHQGWRLFIDMTIINYSHRFLYIHVPKTAGTAVKEYLRPYMCDSDICIRAKHDVEQLLARDLKAPAKHSSAPQIRDLLGAADFESFFRFSFSRNPYGRTVSLFRFLKYTFREWQNSSVMDGFDTLEQFVTSPFFDRPGPGRIMEPQVRWLCDDEKKNCLTFIGRLERLETDMAAVLTALNLPAVRKPVGRKNESRGGRLETAAELVSGRVVDAIRSRYADDFEFLGYSVEPDDAIGETAD